MDLVRLPLSCQSCGRRIRKGHFFHKGHIQKLSLIHIYKNKETDDSRNGYSPKTVTSSMGTINLDIPRDRKGDFEPQIVKKNQTDISNIEDQVLSMYAKGMTTRDISSHLKDVYGVDASAEMISHMTCLLYTSRCV